MADNTAASTDGVMNAARIAALRNLAAKMSLAQLSTLTGLSACTLAGLLREPAETPTRKPIPTTTETTP